ncbi:Josephin-domain-containing protein [Gymnopus androsaceus JB14]|uniref:ubiquitinyl hydrolase 1 n=1 Tax=Gymnopus androsaceus JB14 TaxID=1447944 RepID=A0A6A4IQC8_9AGAR|nr:Josephin-domain-containing protein [Gymnopus androsaceus JB14]
MAGLAHLLPLVYHEKQQPGSMLCAQHALNTLLPADLSEIAQNLDELEAQNLENPGATSNNMDDTVLENALEVWGLSLLRWRAEQMRPYQDHPEHERAFIFNQSQHWYTLRRFGSSEEGEGSSHWFNLNSSLDQPEWVSKLYLHMFIQQAEADGYSVFVVRPIDPDAPLALPKTEADDVAATLPESSGTRTDRLGPTGDGFDGLDDEDMELQMALQASLGHDIPSLPADPLNFYALPFLFPSRRIYERMLAEQTQAHRELAAEGVIDPRRRQELEEEEEMLRRAIAESEAMAKVEGHGRPDDDEENMDVDVARPPPTFTSAGHRVYDDEDEELQAALRASMEDTPANWTPPVEAPASAPTFPRAVEPSRSDSLEDDNESIASEDTALSSDSPAVSAESINVEEMRRRRLARFGA